MGTTHKKFPVKNFPSNWTKPGSDSVGKDSVKKHVEPLQHKEAKRLETKSLLGTEAYQENVVMNNSIAKSFLSLSNEGREGLCIKMKTVYHVIKNEDPYTDYSKLQTKNGVPQLLKSKTQVSYVTDDVCAIFIDFIGRYNVDLLKASVRYFLSNFYFSPNHSSSKTMKNVFYFI